MILFFLLSPLNLVAKKKKTIVGRVLLEAFPALASPKLRLWIFVYKMYYLKNDFRRHVAVSPNYT